VSAVRCDYVHSHEEYKDLAFSLAVHSYRALNRKGTDWSFRAERWREIPLYRYVVWCLLVSSIGQTLTTLAFYLYRPRECLVR